MMRVIYCILVCFVFFSNAEAQQSERYFPALTTIRANKEKTELNPFKGCVSGNCKDGTGIYLSALVNSEVHYSEVENKNSEYYIHFQVCKGNFSDNGQRFTGGLYETTVLYLSNDAGGKKGTKYTPVRSADMSNPQNDTSFTKMIGDAVYNTDFFLRERSYLPHGSMTVEVAKMKGYKKYQPVYKQGKLFLVDVVYEQNDLISSFTGRVREDKELFFGKATYTDGSIYKGFFMNNTYNGPGVYQTTEGTVLQGLWENGSLTVKDQIIFPEELFQVSLPADQDAKVIWENNEINGRFTGNVNQGKAAGWGFFESKEFSSFGQYVDGKLYGPSYAVTFYRNLGLYDIYEYHYGMFVEGWLNAGAIYEVYLSAKKDKGSTVYYTRHAKEIRGNFKNHRLEGCGYYKEWYAESPSKNVEIQGNFKRGFTEGWANVKAQTDSKSYQTGYRYLSTLGEPANELNSATGQQRLAKVYATMKTAEPVCASGKQEDREKHIHEVAALLSTIELRKFEEEQKLLLNEACAAKLVSAGLKEGGVMTNYNQEAILLKYNCEKDSYKLRVLGNTASADKIEEIPGNTFRMSGWKPASKAVHQCSACYGTGTLTFDREYTRTKEVPFGYFSGIETKVTRTVVERITEVCKTCKGRGVLIK